ncbi:TPA: relaxase domain-containing protein [Corynebacterium striatum]|nr:relaxase domain-containing protein [Corynebacterium striatum]HAT1219000.1 relaxase domain-containing protein [Corynebacterium striatum]HAT1413195.1 relaxase domain-containing protein [Corynebacterium striatum]
MSTKQGSGPKATGFGCGFEEKRGRGFGIFGRRQRCACVGKTVENWFNKAVAPSGAGLGNAPRKDSVPGFDLTFCAPKSVSLL